MKSILKFVFLLLGLACIHPAQADRIKDLASVAAIRSNQLIGYGVVVGLNGTGDGNDFIFTTQSVRQMMLRLGLQADGSMTDAETTALPGKLDLKNAAAVLVTADLPGLAKPGQRIDVNVSALGKASSLRGGSLVMTSLRGVDGQVYAIAQGALNVTGVSASAAGSSVTIGVPTAGRIPNGATVERQVQTPFARSDKVVLNTRSADFSTVSAIVNAINARFGDGIANAIDAMSVAIKAPEDLTQRVTFVAEIENIEVRPSEPPARVIVNARTGTVVISRAVKVAAAAVSHGTISVTVAATNEVSQPNALAQGQTQATQNAEVGVSENKKPMFLFQPGIDLRQIVDAVNQVGASPSALIAILEALKTSGSLRAELIII